MTYAFLSISGKVKLPKVLPSSDHEYVPPKRMVFNESSMKDWENSEAYHVIDTFVVISE